MSRSWNIVAPSRLHFGLFPVVQHGVRGFLGAGAMITAPRLRLEVTRAARFSVHGPAAERVRQFAARWAADQAIPLPDLAIDIVEPLPAHMGLGSGTQLAMATVAALEAATGQSSEPQRRYRSVGRGRRSEIGGIGGTSGGFLLQFPATDSDTGRVREVPLPEAWRFVVLLPRQAEPGLSGPPEEEAFAHITAEAPRCDDRHRELMQRLQQTALEGEFAPFSEALYEFGYQAGLGFAAYQHGAFATEQVTRLVQTLRDWGVMGVGQSSWGPAVYALQPSSRQAEDLIRRVHSSDWGSELQLYTAELSQGITVQEPSRSTA